MPSGIVFEKIGISNNLHYVLSTCTLDVVFGAFLIPILKRFHDLCLWVRGLLIKSLMMKLALKKLCLYTYSDIDY